MIKKTSEYNQMYAHHEMKSIKQLDNPFPRMEREKEMML